jgi:hypothetical protein
MPVSPTRKAPGGATTVPVALSSTALNACVIPSTEATTELKMAAEVAELNAMASAAVAHQASNADLNLSLNVKFSIDDTIEPTNISNTSTTGGSTPSTQLGIKRKSIPLSQKKEAIEWIMGPGKGVPSRAEKHFSELNWDVSASSFRKWWKNRDKIMNDTSTKKRITGGGRKPYLEDSEEKILVAVIHERAKKERVTRKWIAKTAQQMFQHTNSQFKASENWVTKFIRRNGLTLKRSYVAQEQEIV